MNNIDKHIVDTYSQMLEGLSSSNKIEIIKKLERSLNAGEEVKDEVFYNSFGAFASLKPAEEIIAEIKGARKFRHKEIKL